jgi:hypothetical protein
LTQSTLVQLKEGAKDLKMVKILTRNKHIHFLIFAMLLISILTCSCSREKDVTPTLGPDQIQTQAVATFATGLTQTAAAQPTNTATQTPTVTPTSTLTPSATPLATAVQFLPTSSCYALTFIKDVTIPDNTKLKPSEEFTKTWRVNNSGSCSWEEGFSFRYFSGNKMDGAAYTLTKEIKSGAELDISIDMIAPKTEGFYTSNWKMADDAGVFFGDNVYVLIEVVTPAATKTPAPPTATPTIEITPTVTETPE